MTLQSRRLSSTGSTAWKWAKNKLEQVSHCLGRSRSRRPTNPSSQSQSSDPSQIIATRHATYSGSNPNLPAAGYYAPIEPSHSPSTSRPPSNASYTTPDQGPADYNHSSTFQDQPQIDTSWQNHPRTFQPQTHFDALANRSPCYYGQHTRLPPQPANTTASDSYNDYYPDMMPFSGDDDSSSTQEREMSLREILHYVDERYSRQECHHNEVIQQISGVDGSMAEMLTMLRQVIEQNDNLRNRVSDLESRLGSSMVTSDQTQNFSSNFTPGVENEGNNRSSGGTVSTSVPEVAESVQLFKPQKPQDIGGTSIPHSNETSFIEPRIPADTFSADLTAALNGIGTETNAGIDGTIFDSSAEARQRPLLDSIHPSEPRASSRFPTQALFENPSTPSAISRRRTSSQGSPRGSPTASLAMPPSSIDDQATSTNTSDTGVFRSSSISSDKPGMSANAGPNWWKDEFPQHSTPPSP